MLYGQLNIAEQLYSSVAVYRVGVHLVVCVRAVCVYAYTAKIERDCRAGAEGECSEVFCIIHRFVRKVGCGFSFVRPSDALCRWLNRATSFACCIQVRREETVKSRENLVSANENLAPALIYSTTEYVV